jgi:IS5 family transposase
MIKLGRRVVAQTKLRVFNGITDSATKIVSVFEPDTRILRRGKVHKPTEFGQMVKVQEAEGGIVIDVAVVTAHDSKLLVPSVEHHKKVFGRVPCVVATDRGFFSLRRSPASTRPSSARATPAGALPIQREYFGDGNSACL